MERIKILRKDAGLSQKELAEALGVHQTAVSQWEQGRTMPDIGLLPCLAEFFNVSVDYILGRTDDPTDYEDPALVASYSKEVLDHFKGNVKEAAAFNRAVHASHDTLPLRKGIKIPVLGRVQAGVPIEAIEDVLEYEEITPEMASTGEFFALAVRGDSMEPRMREGDIVIVKKQHDVDSGEIAVVIVNGYDATVKKVIKRENGLVLQPTNPNHDIMFFTPEEVRELPVEVVGRVVELRAKF